MEIRIPKVGDVYKHFKGNLYEIVIIARDSETLEEKVVYKEVNGDAAYVRSLPMFLSEVDKEKYPNVEQEYRFEYVGEPEVTNEPETEQVTEVESDDAALIIGFLELETIMEKMKYLQNVKEKISNNFLEAVAHSLDFVENEGTLTERYEEILLFLSTIERYEKSRLR